MSISPAVVFAAVTFAAASLSATTVAAAPPPANDAAETAALEAAVAGLKARIAELESEQGDRWLTERRSDEIRALVQDVLADANTRASLQGSGAVAGWNNGFFIGSSDGNFLLNIYGQIQVRYVYNTQDDSPTDDYRSGFETRRAKIYFGGHIVDPTWTYEIEMESSRGTGAFALGENGWMRKDFGNGWAARIGQFKPAYLREEFISSRRLQTVERSLINSRFSAGVAQGVQLEYQQDQFRAFASLNDGRHTSNTGWEVEDTEYAFTARAEYLASGSWSDVQHDVAFNSLNPTFMIGAAVLYQNDEYGTGSNLPAPDFNNAEVQRLGLTVDATAKFESASLSGAFVYENLDTDATGADFDTYGVVIRGGVFVADDLELYGMFEWGDLDSIDTDDLLALTVGVSKFWAEHSLKWQTDLGYGFNAVDSAWATSSAGWRADVADEDGQLVFRSQLQLLF